MAFVSFNKNRNAMEGPIFQPVICTPAGQPTGGSLSGHACQGTITVLPSVVLPCDCGYDAKDVVAIMRDYNDNYRLYDDPSLASSLINDALVIGANRDVTIPAGDFYFSHVTVQKNGSLTCAAGALVRLFVSGSVIMENNSTINSSPTAGSRLAIISAADSLIGESLQVVNNVDSTVDLYAPRARIEINNNAALRGNLVGLGIILHNNGSVARDIPGPAPEPVCAGGLP